jgi:hypothetical protein
MGLFGNNDESDGSAAGSGRGSDPDPSQPDGPDPRVADRVDGVFEASDRRAETRRLVDELDGAERTVAARTLGRVMVADRDALDDETVETAIETLSERDLARAIADGLLHEAEGLRWSGVEPPTVAANALDALETALSEMDRVRLDGGGVPAGGGSEAALGQRLRERADAQGNRGAQLVYEATADAFERVPKLLASRGESDPIDAVVDLRVACQRGETMALDVESGRPVEPTATNGSIGPTELSARLVDGVVLAVVVLLDRGTVTQLEPLTGSAVRE